MAATSSHKMPLDPSNQHFTYDSTYIYKIASIVSLGALAFGFSLGSYNPVQNYLQ